MAKINSTNFPMTGLSPTSPSTSTNGTSTNISGFPQTYPRPQWLFSREELEELLSSLEIKLSELRTNKNNSALVERVLERILADRENENTFPAYKVENGVGLHYQPDNYELLLARLHLAIEIQSILVDWCTRGMEETRKTSYLGQNDMNGGDGSAQFDVEFNAEAGMQTPVTGGRLRRSTSESSAATTCVASESPNTTLTTPPSSVGGIRASKRRNLGSGDHYEVQGPPRLSLVTTESILPTVLSATSYQFPESASTCTSAKRRWGEGVYSGSAGYAITPSSALFSAQPLSAGQSVMSISPATSISDKTPYYCPYYLMNSNNDYHKECATKAYPNPRKLKEHVWRYTRPFRCEKCGEGFGRDKTRAIHMEKKTPCKPRPATEYDEGTGIYEGSREQLRDRKIETAKSTLEIINILREYEQGIAVNPPTTLIANQTPNQIPTAPMMFQDPFSGHQKQQPDLHAMAQVQASYLQGLGLDFAGTFDNNVPKIIVQPAAASTCEMLANTQFTNTLAKSTLEGQGWKPIELQNPTTPPMKQQQQPTHTRNLQQGTLSPPTQQDPANRTNLRMSTPKSPTPDLTYNGPSPMPSPMSIQDGDDHDNVIYESPLTTPSINITYWRADSQKSQSSTPTEPIIVQEQADSLPVSQQSLPQQARTMSLNGLVPSMGLQRRATAGSFDQLAYNLLEDIESSWCTWDNNNYNYRY